MSALPSYVPVPPEQDELLSLLLQANEAGIKLEIVGDKRTWEAFPMARHQIALKKVESSVTRIKGSPSDCACFTLQDVYIKFPDGSIKRPDLSIFCQEPAELDEIITRVPLAIVEVVSPGYEQKDLVDGQAFYREQGVLDVVVLNPHTKRVHHFDAAGEHVHASPVKIDLKCGCQVTA